ncbi:MAG: MMPL family transporter [Nitriliruptoraceae bacterium]|nr:MMPL family transporter [Nitriliruptoraceae bacterium]
MTLTALLAVPFLTSGSEEIASQEPAGAVFDARDALDERFGGDVIAWNLVMEANDGQILDRDGLLALRERIETLQGDPVVGPTLLERTDPVTGQRAIGVQTIGDAIDGTLRQAGLGGLDGADDAAVATVAGQIIDERGPGALGVSVQATRDEDSGWWTSPALVITVLADTAAIDGAIDADGDTDVLAVEAAARAVEAVLDGGDDLDAFGIILDQNLTAGEQGEAAGPYIGFTVLTAIVLVGVAFSSYWTLAVVGAGLIALLVWLEGISNLIGLADDQILATIVPIAMIAFGVDYAFHAVGRYREERAAQHDHQRDDHERALARGLAGVTPALLLALGTGAFAFLANAISGIQSITQFGIAAAIALTAAYLVLGIVVPVAVALIERHVEDRPVPGGRVLGVGAGLAAAATAMAAVLFVVFLDPAIGLGLLAAYLVVFLLVPALLIGRRAPVDVGSSVAFTASKVATGRSDDRHAGMREPEPAPPTDGRIAAAIGRAVSVVAARRIIVLPLAAVLTGIAAVSAVQVPTAFDVEDFFTSDSGFVVGIEKVEEHIGDQGGEPADVYISTDLDDPAAVAAVTDFVAEVAALDTDLLARSSDGSVAIDAEALTVLAGTSSLSPLEASQLLAPADDDGYEAIRFELGLVGTRAQENVEATRDLLDPMVADLQETLEQRHPGSQAVLTGGPIIRQASLDAVSDSLQTSIPIAVLLCLLIAWGVMRSLRYAVVSLVPILLVIAWLYGFMNVAGFSVNLVTGTIGAISVGVGIAYAIHFTMRYRQELRTALSRMEALHAAAVGTGLALVGSTVSSVAGFAILAFAPMPLFANYGLLTAIMIVLALLSSLLVLPGLLLLVSQEPVGPEEPGATDLQGEPVGAMQ